MSASPGGWARRAPTARSRARISLSSATDVSGASPDFSIRSRKARDTWQCDCPGHPGQSYFSLNGSTGLERAKGIEPSYAAWEAAVLRLYDARNLANKTWR